MLGWPRQEIQGSRDGSKTRDLKEENHQPEGETQEEQVWAGLLGWSTEPVTEYQTWKTDRAATQRWKHQVDISSSKLLARD